MNSGTTDSPPFPPAGPSNRGTAPVGPPHADAAKSDRLGLRIEAAGREMSLPEGARQLIAAGDLRGQTNQALVRWLASDRPLASRLLRWCNTPLFNLAEPFANLHQAAGAMNSGDLARLAVLAWVRTLFQPDVRIDIYSRDFLWCHGIAVGAVASLIARTSGVGDASEAFLAGGLHDIGLCASERLDPSGFARVLADVDALSPTQEVERDHQGWDHAELGGEILKTWGMSEAICDAASLHHDPQRSLARGSRSTVGCVALANYFCSRAGQGSTGSHHILPPDSEIMRTIGVDGGTLAILWKQVPVVIAASRMIR